MNHIAIEKAVRAISELAHAVIALLTGDPYERYTCTVCGWHAKWATPAQCRHPLIRLGGTVCIKSTEHACPCFARRLSPAEVDSDE